MEAISSSAPAVSQPSRVGTETLWLFVGLGRVIFALISDLFQHLYIFFRPLLRNDEQQQWYRQYRLTISPTFSLLRSGLTGVTVERGKFRYQIRFDSCQRCPLRSGLSFTLLVLVGLAWRPLSLSLNLWDGSRSRCGPRQGLVFFWCTKTTHTRGIYGITFPSQTGSPSW